MSLTATAADPYYSRSGEEWEAVDRQDPVVWGDRSGPLPSFELGQYEQRGYHFLPHRIAMNEAGGLLTEAHRLAEAASPTDEEVVVEPESNAVRSIFRVHRRSEAFRSICKDPRILDVVRQLIGGDVYIHQSRINFKRAFEGNEFFWHSDFETWHVEDGMPRMRALSVSISLTETTEFNGPLMVVPGSHHWFIRCVGETPEKHFERSLKKQEYGVPSREALEFLVDKGGIHAPKGNPGSALFFDCNTMHGSVSNLSPYPRTNLFVVYNSVENGLREPFGDRSPRPEFLAEREVLPIDDL